MGRLSEAYSAMYSLLCGSHPEIRPWHFQYMPTRDLVREVKSLLPELRGRVLDVGCQEKPYKRWATNATEWVGLDIEGNPFADIQIKPDSRWPLPDSCLDVVVSTQMLLFVRDLDLFFSEVNRVLKPGGYFLITAPFIYNESIDSDFWRFSIAGGRELVKDDFIVVVEKRLGKFGAVLAQVILNWMELQSNKWRVGRLLKGALLPAWILFSALVNLNCILLDWIDSTGKFYLGILILAQKKDQ